MPDGLGFDVPEREIDDPGQVDCLYMLLLGRRAESDEARAGRCGETALEIAEQMFCSAEFRELVSRALRNGALAHDRLPVAALREVMRFAAQTGLVDPDWRRRAMETRFERPLCGLSNPAFVAAAYWMLLGRKPDPDEAAHCLALAEAADEDGLASARQRIIGAILHSEELVGRAAPLPFGWRDALGEVFASGPLRRLLILQNGRDGRRFVAALRPVRAELTLQITAAIGDAEEGEPADTLLLRERLWIRGWAAARNGIAAIEVMAGEQCVGAVRSGLPSPDAGRVFADWRQSDGGGFAAMVPRSQLPNDIRVLRIVARDTAGNTTSAELFLEPCDDSIHANGEPAVTDRQQQVYDRILRDCDWQACFCVVMTVALDEEILAAARASIAALHAQAYENWRLIAVASAPDARRAELRDRLAADFPGAAERIIVVPPEIGPALARLVRQLCGGHPPLVLPLDPGVIVEVSALFEFAAASALYREAELITSAAVPGGARLCCAVIALLDRGGAGEGGLSGHALQARLAGLANDALDLPFSLSRRSDSVLHSGRAAANDADLGEELLKFHIDRPEMPDPSAEFPIRGQLFVQGWALARDGVAAIDLAVDGEFVTSSQDYGLLRLDVAKGHPDWAGARQSGFTISVLARSLPQGKHFVRVSLRDRRGRTKAVDFRIKVTRDLEASGLRRKVGRAELDMKERLLQKLDWNPGFCLVIRTGASEEHKERLQTTLASLARQAYGRWNAAIIVEGQAGEGAAASREEGDSAAFRDDLLRALDGFADRVTLLPDDRPGTLGKLAAFWGNAAFFGILAAGDELAADALLEFAMASGLERSADFFYSDELRVSPVSGTMEPFLKPQWSPDLLLSTNYIGRFWCASAKLAERAGATVDTLLQCGDYDLVLRMTEAAQAIRHVPEVLCRRSQAALDSEESEQQALEGALARRGLEGEIVATELPGTYRRRRPSASAQRVSIIIPTCASRGLVRTCLETIHNVTTHANFEIIAIDTIPADKFAWKAWLRANCDKVVEGSVPFNWSEMNNRAAREAEGEFLLFLNDDIEVVEPDWIEALLAHAERPEIGVVGARLLYPDGTVQHAGMFWVPGTGGGGHAFRHLPASQPGYFGLAQTTRNVLAVTGACMMVRRDWFEEIGGFDESHGIVNNDVDFCLRCWEKGRRIVYEPAAMLIHHERASRAALPEGYDVAGFWRKWGGLLNSGDPFYHPNLARDRDDYAVEEEPVQAIHAGSPLFRNDEIRRILLVKLDHIGDFITAIPAINRLRQHFPAAELFLLAPPANRVLTGIFVPEIKEIIGFEYYHTRSGLGRRELATEDLAKLQSHLAPYRFDLAIDLRKDLDTRDLLRLTGARWLAGYDRDSRFPWLDIALEWEDATRMVEKRSHISDDLLRLIDAVALAGNPERQILQLAAGASAQGSDRRDKALVCIHPAVGTETRQWPPEHFATLIDLLVANHPVEILLIGSADETPTARAVMEKVEHKTAVNYLVGTLPLSELPGLLNSAALFIGNNSGPKHIAAGLGVPTIGIHSGVVDAQEWGPLGPNAIALQRDMRCSPCYLATVDQCPRGLACLTALSPASVYQLCRRMLYLR